MIFFTSEITSKLEYQVMVITKQHVIFAKKFGTVETPREWLFIHRIIACKFPPPNDIRNTVLNAFLKEYGSSPLDENSDDYYFNNNGNQITKKPRLATDNSTLHNFNDRI